MNPIPLFTIRSDDGRDARAISTTADVNHVSAVSALKRSHLSHRRGDAEVMEHGLDGNWADFSSGFLTAQPAAVGGPPGV